MFMQVVLVVAGGVPSFEGGYIEEEKRRQAYVRFEGADCVYNPAGLNIDTTLLAVSGGYSQSWGGARRGSCPAAFINVAGQCSNFQAEFLVRSIEADPAAAEPSSDLAMLAARYAGRSPDGFTFLAECGLGHLDTTGAGTDTQLQLGVGAASGQNGISEIGVMLYTVRFAEETGDDYNVYLVRSVYMAQPARENWLLLGAQWKRVDIDAPSAPETDTLSLSADWYFLREAYVGFQFSKADCGSDAPVYCAPPAGVLGKHMGYRIRGGYEGRSLVASAWFEPRTREDSTEFAWGLSGAYKF